MKVSKGILSIIVFMLLVILSTNVVAEICTGRKVKKAKTEEYDNLAFLTSAEESKLRLYVMWEAVLLMQQST